MKKLLSFTMIAILLFPLYACSKSDNSNIISGTLIYESIEYPNKDSVQSEEDRIFYKIQVYQNDDYVITVNAASNSGFFEDLQYTIDADTQISKDDVTVKWLNMMGSEQVSADNQACIADVIILGDERKVSFISKAIEIISETLE